MERRKQSRSYKGSGAVKLEARCGAVEQRRLSIGHLAENKACFKEPGFKGEKETLLYACTPIKGSLEQYLLGYGDISYQGIVADSPHFQFPSHFPGYNFHLIQAFDHPSLLSMTTCKDIARFAVIISDTIEPKESTFHEITASSRRIT